MFVHYSACNSLMFDDLVYVTIAFFNPHSSYYSVLKFGTPYVDWPVKVFIFLAEYNE
jgi:hypothetical protein